MSQILTVESALPDTKMLSRNSIPEVKLWITTVNLLVFLKDNSHLMAHEGMPAGTRFDIPDPDGGVQGPGHHVNPIKLSSSMSFRIRSCIRLRKRGKREVLCASAEVGVVGG